MEERKEEAEALLDPAKAAQAEKERSYDNLLPTEKERLHDEYSLKHRASILYFRLRHDFNPDTDYATGKPDDPCILATLSKQLSIARGESGEAQKNSTLDRCVSATKLSSFLTDKFIGARDCVQGEVCAQEGTTSDGRMFLMKYINRQTPTIRPDILMADFITYVLSRPREAVPDPVADLIRPPTLTDDKWPGSIMPRTSFMPPAARDGTSNYVDKDIEPFKLDKKDPHTALILAESGLNPFEPTDKEMDKITLEEEEGILFHSHLFRNIFYLAMATMGISVPLLALYVFVRMSPPVQMVQPVPSNLPSTAAGSGLAAMHVQNAIREQIVPGGGMMARVGDGLAGMIFGFKSRFGLTHPTLPVDSRTLPPPTGLGGGEEARLADLAANAWNPLQPKSYQTGLQALGGANNSTMERIRQLEQENYRLRTMEEDDRRSSRLAELQSENERLRILKTRKEQRGNFNW